MRDVAVRITLDIVPSAGGHTVIVRNGAGTICWATMKSCPNPVSLHEGELMTVDASIRSPTRRGVSSVRESASWRLRVHRGAHASLHLGEWTLRRPLQRIDVDVQGAEITS
jgi:hypothetical protein